MKAAKNAVLKYSEYTTALTRSLKATKHLHCRVDEENNAVYVCNGYFVVKLNPAEYDTLVRPVTQREAGNFVTYNGETDTSREPLDMEKLLADAAQAATHDLTPAPFLVAAPCSKSTKAKIVPYYSESGDFVAGFNSDYAAIISASLPRKGKNPTSPMVVFSGSEPQAMILPVRLGSEEKPSRIPDAVRAYFTGKPIEAAQTEQTPTDKAAALVEQLAALEGITATIKGAQTAAPVVWLAGEADTHKEKIEAMGGKWSVKRSAWYFKI